MESGRAERDVECEVEVISWQKRIIRAELLVNADVQFVWKALTDYEKLADFIPNLVSRMREIFLKQDNLIQGRFLGELTKQVFSDLEASKYQGLQFLGLLCGNWCKYIPILTLDKITALSDLPLTLSSFLQDLKNRINVVEDPIISTLWRLMERIYSWATSIASKDYAEAAESINRSEDDDASLILVVVYEACVLLKNYMSLEMQLKFANMVLPLLDNNYYHSEF